MNWPERKFLLLLVVVFSTSLGAGLAASLEEKETAFPPASFDSGGSVLSRTKTEEFGSFPVERNKEVNNKKILAKTAQTVDLSQAFLEEEAKGAASRLAEVLEKNDLPLTYDLLGGDLKAIFTKDDFFQSSFSFPGILQARIVSGPKVFGEWSEFIVEVVLEDRSEKNYFVVFHLEDREWKLFGTQEISS